MYIRIQIIYIYICICSCDASTVGGSRKLCWLDFMRQAQALRPGEPTAHHS